MSRGLFRRRFDKKPAGVDSNKFTCDLCFVGGRKPSNSQAPHFDSGEARSHNRTAFFGRHLPVRQILSVSGGDDRAALAIHMPRTRPDLQLEYVFWDARKELTEANEYLNRVEAIHDRWPRLCGGYANPQ
jgi:hypothetical protein